MSRIRVAWTWREDRGEADVSKTLLENAEFPGVPTESPIAPQMHGGSLRFANVHIKELK